MEITTIIVGTAAALLPLAVVIGGPLAAVWLVGKACDCDKRDP